MIIYINQGCIVRKVRKPDRRFSELSKVLLNEFVSVLSAMFERAEINFCVWRNFSLPTRLPTRNFPGMKN